MKNKTIYPIGWIFLFIVFLVFRLGEMHNIASFAEWLFIIATPFVAYCIRNERHLAIQMFVINLYFGAVWGFALINKFAHKNHKILILVGAIAFLLCAVFLLREVLLYIKNVDYYALLRKYWPLFIPIIIFIILSIETIFEIPWQDGEYYYCWEIKKMSYWFDYTWMDISDYTFAGHFSLGYALIALLAELIYPQNAVVLHSFNIVLAIVSGISLYRILNYVYPNRGRFIKTICVSIYLLSPWVLGMIGYINIDTPSIFFFIILISSYLYKKKVLLTVFAFLFVFTKEPSVVYFAFFCFGIIICEIIITRRKDNNVNSKNSIIHSFLVVLKNHIPELLVGISWFACYLMNYKNMWGGVGGSTSEIGVDVHRFGFTLDNVYMKFKGVMVLNFNWIFLLIIVIGVICSISNKNIRFSNITIIQYESIIYSTFLGFIIFNLLYLDLDHPRYNAIGAILLILIAMDIILKIKETIILKIFSVILAIILTIQSMITIDPVSKKVYGTVSDYGKTEILSRVNFVYNREYSYYYGAINKVLESSNYDGSQDVSLMNVMGTYGPLYDYWWDQKAHRMTSTTNDNTVMINFIFDTEGYDEYNPEHKERIIIYPYSANLTGDYEVETYRTFSLKYQLEAAY